MNIPDKKIHSQHHFVTMLTLQIYLRDWEVYVRVTLQTLDVQYVTHCTQSGILDLYSITLDPKILFNAKALFRTPPKSYCSFENVTNCRPSQSAEKGNQNK